MENYTEAGKKVFPFAVNAMESILEKENTPIDFLSLFRLYRAAMHVVNLVTLKLFFAHFHPTPREVVTDIAGRAAELVLRGEKPLQYESNQPWGSEFQAAATAVAEMYSGQPMGDVRKDTPLVLAAYRTAVDAVDSVFVEDGWSPFYEPAQAEGIKRFWGIAEDVLIAAFRSWKDQELRQLGEEKYQQVMGE